MISLNKFHHQVAQTTTLSLSLSLSLSVAFRLYLPSLLAGLLSCILCQYTEPDDPPCRSRKRFSCFEIPMFYLYGHSMYVSHIVISWLWYTPTAERTMKSSASNRAPAEQMNGVYCTAATYTLRFWSSPSKRTHLLGFLSPLTFKLARFKGILTNLLAQCQ